MGRQLTTVWQQKRPKIPAHQLRRHGQLLAGRVEIASFAEQIIRDLLGGYDDVVAPHDVQPEDRPVRVCPRLELQP